MTYTCPNCNTNFDVEHEDGGITVQCPSCSVELTLPSPVREASPPPVAPPAGIYCRQCGQLNDSNHVACSGCGASLRAPQQPIYVPKTADGLNSIIPVTNPPSLWAYYLGVFALVPCFGLPLGIAAVSFGIGAVVYGFLFWFFVSFYSGPVR